MPYGELFRLAKAGKPLQTTPDTFGVSAQIARCRINRTGLALVAFERGHEKG